MNAVIGDVVARFLKEGHRMVPCGHTGVHIFSPLGYTISIQCGWGNYCDHYAHPGHDLDGLSQPASFWFGSSTAEVAAWATSPYNEHWYCPPDENPKYTWVGGYFTATQTLDFVRHMLTLTPPIEIAEVEIV